MRRTRLFAPVAAIAVALASCGGSDGGGPGPDTGAPTVTSMSITDGETEVGLVERITVTFSEPMDSATINDTTFVVAGRSAVGHIDYNESTRTASFLPDSLMAPETWHDLVLTNGITDAGGTAFEGSTTAFQTGAVACGSLTDHMEPNDEIAQASPIELDRTYHGLTGCNDDRDLFEFLVPGTLKVRAQAHYRRADDEVCYVYFRRSSGESYTYVGAAVNDGSDLGTQYTFHPGTYYVDVVGTGGYENWVLYELTLHTSAPCNDDEFEDNDFRDEAPQIVPGTLEGLQGCYYDDDWFAVQADPGELITLTVIVTSGYAPIAAGIYGPSGAELAYDTSSNSPLWLSATAQESGAHHVFATFGGSGIVYDLTVGVSD